MKLKVSCQYLLQINRILTKLNPVEIVTAKNADEAKTAWLDKAKQGFFTDPYLTYDRELLKEVNGYNAELVMAKSRISHGLVSEKANEEAVKLLLLNRIEDAIITTEMAASILLDDDKSTSELSKKLYGYPSNSQALRAYEIASGEAEYEAKKSRFTKKDQKALKALSFNASEIGHWFSNVLDFYGIRGWAIDIAPSYTSIDVRDKNMSGTPTICIPEKRQVDGLKLLELIGHELECHLRGSENCRALIGDIIGYDSPIAPLIPVIAKSDNELFYEGVAKMSDVEINGSDGMPLPYATIACDQARRKANFSEIARVIFDYRLKHQSEEKALSGAWTTTYRIMRGATNTANGGYSFTKDYIYTCGYEKAQQANPKFHQFGSLTVPELTMLYEIAGINLKPKYEYADAVKYVKNKLLA